MGTFDLHPSIPDTRDY